ncbi:MAG: hypothetical protein NVS4B10_10780 [Myxococcales bacterium]
MIGLFHRLRKDEEGQALVLAALFGLVLALCVLGTVNLGRAVYDKMQLQTACDDGAYSQAAVEARVLNFTAYTNRAMVVHYASILAMSAFLTWIHFNWAFIKAGLTLARLIPPISGIVDSIDRVATAIVRVLDRAVALATPLLSAANLALYGLQEGAWWGVALQRLSRTPPEAHSGDSAAHPYQPIWPHLVPLANQTVFAQARGHANLIADAEETARILVNAKSPVVQQARLHMLEIANSARTPWVAYGDRFENPSRSPGGRHWKWPLFICSAQVGAVARTELGTFPPADRPSSASTGAGQAQVFSADRLQADIDCDLWLFSITGYVQLFAVATLDQLFQNRSSRALGMNSSGLLGMAVGQIFGATGVFAGMKRFAAATLPAPDQRPFFVSPYVYFHPRAAGKPGGGLSGSPGNFAQPDVVFGLAKEGRDYNREPGADALYGRRFSFDGKAAGLGAVDFAYRKKDGPRIGGLPLLRQGLNTFCAAQVYYHRPGDWREMPNFFNPLWGARLMPVLESNAAAALGLTSVPGPRALLQH